MRNLMQSIKQIEAGVFGFAELIKYAVFIPIVEVEGKPSILFEVRSHQMRRQPGEICFPGGKVDADDENEMVAAVRETSEELGIPMSDIEVTASLGVLVPPVQTGIYPFIGRIKSMDAIQPNKAEVEYVFTVPLEYLLQLEPEAHELKLGIVPTDAFPFHLIPGGKEYKFRKRTIPEYFYTYQNHIIWGLTARILKEFLDHLKR